MRRDPGFDRFFVALLLVSLAAVGAALLSQYRFGMQPCAWCVLQRAIFFAIAASALVGLLWRGRLGGRVGSGLAGAFGICGGAAALWQHFVAAASASCNQSLADIIIGRLGLDAMSPTLFAPRASCADARVDLFGVPYEFFSLLLFALIAILALRRSAAGAS